MKLPRFADVSRRCCWALGFVVGLVACGSSVPKQPPGQPPTPATVSNDQPGGDAFDPHKAALLRQLSEPWGLRNDKDDQLHVPTPDWKNWKRVRFRMVNHFTGFRYGKEHHVMALAFLLDVPPDSKQTSESCMNRFEAWARPQLSDYEVTFGEFKSSLKRWHNAPLQVNYVDGHVDVGLQRYEFSVAWGAYAAYPDACLIYAVAVPWFKQGELARKVRDRWVAEGFQNMRPLTPLKPVRLPEPDDDR